MEQIIALKIKYIYFGALEAKYEYAYKASLKKKKTYYT